MQCLSPTYVRLIAVNIPDIIDMTPPEKVLAGFSDNKAMDIGKYAFTELQD
jgi:hypothetical protein